MGVGLAATVCLRPAQGAVFGPPFPFGALASLDSEAEWLDAELVGPVRPITQDVLKFPIRRLTGEESLDRAEVSVNEAPKVCRVWVGGDRRRVPASGSALTGSFYRFSDERLQEVSPRVRVHRVPDF
jgi:hypothetical protein